MQKSSAGKRILAFLLDLLILNLVIIQPIAFRLQKVIPLTTVDITAVSAFLQAHPAVAKELDYLSVLAMLLIYSYFVLMEYFIGQTIGKKIMKLYVVATGPFLQHEKGNYKITFVQAMLRNVCVLPLFPLVLLWIIDPLYLLFKKERFSDNYAHTAVIVSP